MGYSNFTYKKVRNELGIRNKQAQLFPEKKLIEPSQFLLDALERSKLFALFSEKSRSESIVAPIITEIYQKNKDAFAYYSGAVVNGDSSRELTGECDFVLSLGEQDYELDTPLFCLIEAKDHDIEQSIPQCIAQMEGARLYNEKEGKNIGIIHGCVTIGTEWQFLRLENEVCYVDIDRYYLEKLDKILGALQAMIDFYR